MGRIVPDCSPRQGGTHVTWEFSGTPRRARLLAKLSDLRVVHALSNDPASSRLSAPLALERRGGALSGGAAHPALLGWLDGLRPPAHRLPILRGASPAAATAAGGASVLPELRRGKAAARSRLRAVGEERTLDQAGASHLHRDAPAL